MTTTTLNPCPIYYGDASLPVEITDSGNRQVHGAAHHLSYDWEGEE
jgi:hypothetical protein